MQLIGSEMNTEHKKTFLKMVSWVSLSPRSCSFAVQSQLKMTHNLPSKLFFKLTLCASRLSLNSTNRREIKAHVNIDSVSNKGIVLNIKYLIMQD